MFNAAQAHARNITVCAARQLWRPRNRLSCAALTRRLQVMSIEFTTTFLVRTKLHRPRVTNGLVPLARARQSLAYDLDRPLTLVCAPAGFGKTTLLCDWLANAPRPSAWLSLDERDSDLATFLTYLVAAIRTLFPTACTEMQALLQATELPPLPVLSATLSNEIDSLADGGLLQAGERFVLALDDYHRISSQDVHQVLSDLLLHPPRPLHLALGTRYDPPLPLTTLRARGQLVEIRSGVLRFTGDEVAAFLRQTLQFAPDQQTVSLVEKRTEGWVAGLRFAALALNARGSAAQLIPEVSAENRFAMEYLFSEVLTRLPSATQAFLMQTAILERLSGPLCDALGGEAPSAEAGQRHLEWLERENIFTVALDDQGVWYRYHHLFQRLLQGQLARQYRAEEIAGLHSRASGWYGANGFIEDALHHALAAGDKRGAAHLVETHRHATMNHSQFQRLEQWLHILPPQLIAERPELLMLEAWIMQYRWQLADLPLHLDRIEALLAQTPLPEPEEDSLRSEIDALRSYVCFYATDGKGALAFAEQSLQCAPMAHSAVRGFAWMTCIGALQLQGDFRGAQNALYASLEEDRYHGNTFPISPLIAHCTVGWMAGDLAALQQSALRLQQLAYERNLPGNHAWAHHFLGCAAYQLNDLVSAEREFDSVVSKRRNAHGHAFWQGALGLASVYLAQGENERAQTLGVSLQASAWEMGSAGAMRDAQALQAFLALRLGRKAEAQRWAAAYDRSQPLMPMPMFYAAPLLLAKILLDQASPQSFADAESWLSRLHEFVVTTHNTRFQIEVLALEALLHETRGAKTASLDALGQAVRLAEPGSLLRVFLDLGQPMATLLERLGERDDAPGFVHKLLHAFPSPSAPSITPAPFAGAQGAASGSFAGQTVLIEPLTRREQEVLDLLAQRLTAGEIALQLVVSAKTVKRHTANIYQKLGVNRRKDALTAAQAAGLLADR